MKANSVRVLFASLCLMSLGIPAATASGGVPGGNGAPGTAADSSAAPANAQVEYVPAFSNDLPTGQADLTAADSKKPSAGVTPAVSWICTVYASDPRVAIHNSRQSIEGEGWQSCTGSTYWLTAIKVTVQKYKGLGFWNNLYQYNSGYTSEAWLERIVWWYCTSGNGWQTYRIVTDGYQGTYHQAVQSLNYLRAYCPA